MLVRNMIGLRIINGKRVRKYRTVEVPEDYQLDKYLEVVKKDTSKEKIEVKVEKEEDKLDYDLNGDGVFNDKDKSIAGKVLASKRKKTKKGE